jgi:YHS domain-containing protein
VRTFAQELRPDIYVSVRAYHLKHAVQAMGTDLLRMQGFFLLAAVTMPFSWDEINEAKGWMTKWRRDVCNQIDVGHTARGFCAAKGETVEETAKRTLGAEVGIQASDKLWEKDVQGEIRQRLDVDLPFTLCDVNGGTIIVLVLPSDAVVTFNAGILTFNENPDADYLAHDADREEDIRAAEDDVAPVADARSSATSKPLDKTIGEWEKEQAQFAHLPRLPPHWVRVVSQKTGEVYFFNKRTQEATFEEPKVAEPPLPDGWTKQVSKSTGKTYYFHAGKKKSQFERPTE